MPYKGAAPALQDVIAGHVQMMFATASSVVPHIQDGKLRALAVATLKRTAVFPDIPTIDELGIKNFDATTWHGLVTRAGTPQEVVATLNRALVATLEDAAVKKSLGDLGVDIIGGTPGGVRGLHQIRNSQMDRDHQGVGRRSWIDSRAMSPTVSIPRRIAGLDPAIQSRLGRPIRRLAKDRLADQPAGDARSAKAKRRHDAGIETAHEQD